MSSTVTLLHQALQQNNLLAAWKRVRENKGAAGVDGITIDAFEHRLLSRLYALREAVLNNHYLPQPLRELHIPKPDGGERRLAIPAVADRLLQTTVAHSLSPLLELEFEAHSFAYRPGRSVPMAVAQVMALRDQGYQWVVDADIRGFFDQINHKLLIEQLRHTLPDQSLLPLIDQWLNAVVHPEEGHPYLLTRGVPQGSPLSPLLSNLYLDPLDEALIAAGYPAVRYADDFLILCRDHASATAALAFTHEALARLHLDIQTEKTRITSFSEGFQFLGVAFQQARAWPLDEEAAPWLLPQPPDEATPLSSGDVHSTTPPPTEESSTTISSARTDLPFNQQTADNDEGAGPLEAALHYEENPLINPLLRSVYVTRHGLTLLKESNRLLITDGATPLASIPLFKVDQLVLQGNQLVSTALLRFAADNGLVVTFIDPIGRPALTLADHNAVHLERQRAQFARESDERLVAQIARELIGAKIHNSRVLLRRQNRRRDITEVSEAITQLERLETQLLPVQKLNAMRGIEGQAAHLYFQAIRALLPEHWQFPGRRRRPPTDPLNVLLSYGYGVLHSTLLTLVTRQRLNPWLGTLHSASGRHAALVADLMEPFRALLVDAVALNALNNTLHPENFILDATADLPCRMDEATRKNYLQWLQNKFRTTLQHPQSSKPIDLHRLLHYQVWHYSRVISGEEERFRAWRSR